MLKADFQSVRGPFKFGQQSASDPGLVRRSGWRRTPDGKAVIKTLGKVISNQGDALLEGLQALSSRGAGRALPSGLLRG